MPIQPGMPTGRKGELGPHNLSNKKPNDANKQPGPNPKNGGTPKDVANTIRNNLPGKS